MFCNQYDNDVTVWGPQGMIHQIEYTMEAVKQGSATVGLKSKTHAVLVALKRAQSELVAHQKKILHVDNHIGVSVVRITADARLLCNFIHQECLDSRVVFDRPLLVSRLVSLIGSKTQISTQSLQFMMMMMMMYLHSWKVLKKDHRGRHSLLSLLMNLQRRLMSQWSTE
uniref:Proteasome alpha-type subunits domain-containing protein n=1 Tax=Oryctolagus cuniculus TaxID=9986 RepID=A0A5F9CGA0_RABIT